jgi:hypothetical protein
VGSPTRTSLASTAPSWAGLAGNRYRKGCVVESDVDAALRPSALSLFRAFLAESGATHIQAQTNDVLLTTLLYDCASRITSDTLLSSPMPVTTHLPCSDVQLRLSQPGDRIFAHHHEPVGDWLLDRAGDVVATGGTLHHYNPYADLYMEVAEPHRRRGYV